MYPSDSSEERRTIMGTGTELSSLRLLGPLNSRSTNSVKFPANVLKAGSSSSTPEWTLSPSSEIPSIFLKRTLHQENWKNRMGIVRRRVKITNTNTKPIEKGTNHVEERSQGLGNCRQSICFFTALPIAGPRLRRGPTLMASTW